MIEVGLGKRSRRKFGGYSDLNKSMRKRKRLKMDCIAYHGNWLRVWGGLRHYLLANDARS
jgi:hypothetical protein